MSILIDFQFGMIIDLKIPYNHPNYSGHRNARFAAC